MKVSLLAPEPLKLPGSINGGESVSSGDEKAGFGKLLLDKLNEVNQLQRKADTITENFLAGQNVDLHEVMIAVEKASLAMQMTLEVRNKLLEAYQHISNMQI